MARRAAQRVYAASYRERHPEVVNAWRLANPVAYREAQKRWREAHLGEMRVHSQHYRARLRAAPGEFTVQDVASAVWLQGGLCFYCPALLSAGYHVEHMTPLSRGGTNHPDNIVCACVACNVRKHDKTALEFVLGLKKGLVT